MNAVFDKTVFDPDCTDCPRIVSNLQAVKKVYPAYYCRPVPPFGAKKPGVLIVGLGPGQHGANATGRPFTGDFAGILLYETLHKFGFANKPVSEHAGDGLILKNCRITNAVKCLPPANKPLPVELSTCNHYLKSELAETGPGIVIIALGKIAHDAVLTALQLKRSQYVFAHNAVHRLNTGRTLVDSYHCSRYNTQTRRLTEAMFHEVFKTAVKIIDAGN